MAPIVGITAWPRAVDLLGTPQPNQTVPTSHVSSIRRAGGTPVLLPVVPDDGIDDLLDAVDGVVLTGGGDLQPARYGADIEPETDRVDPDRDRFDLAVMDRVLARRTPALAVCRGIQILNVAAGGVLANDSDLEGNPLTAVLVSGPSNGTLSLNADGSFSYA
ncbi:MAG: gamma-glutamyl-gamma-aminobutyrate hydrolase family protein, partial [Acidimicrobiales bacterium]